MSVQDYLTIMLVLITALVAIRGETWDKNNKRPTIIGWVAAGLALGTFGTSMWGVKSEQELKANIKASAVSELVVSLDSVAMEVLSYQHLLAFSSASPDTGKIREQCDYSSGLLTRHRDVFYPELSIAISLLRSACDVSIESNITWDETENMVSKIQAVKNEVCLRLGHKYSCKY